MENILQISDKVRLKKLDEHNLVLEYYKFIPAGSIGKRKYDEKWDWIQADGYYQKIETALNAYSDKYHNDNLHRIVEAIQEARNDISKALRGE